MSEIESLIRREMKYRSLSSFDMCNLLCMSIATWYRKIKNPSLFSLFELSVMNKVFGWGDEERRLVFNADADS